MFDKDKFKLHTCFHCGNQGLMPIKFIHSHNFGGPVYDEIGNIVDLEFEEHFNWILLSCPVCEKVTLLEEYTDGSSCDHYTAVDTLYPQSTIDYTGVPDNIKRAFESALKVKNIDSAICALALRRVLEAICKERGASGSNLEAMISDMIKRNVLPKMFDDACWIVRQLGNSAAHGDNKYFSRRQVDQTILFMQNIINYLYTLPVKMNEMRSELELEKLKKKD